MIFKFFFIYVVLLLSGCYLNPYHKFYFAGKSQIGHYKIGNSYMIDGISYKPQYYDYYEEVGIASWYGAESHNKTTANGDKFNRFLLTAAHKTLPLPSFVEVTNLENGKKVIVKVNDRGPFVSNRIIDLSEKAAIVLGFRDKGIAKVKITYLKKMSQELVHNVPSYRKYYEKIIENYRKNKSNTNAGYLSKIKDVNYAKYIISKLRSQGLRNVRLLFKNDTYYVYVN
ncbi:septal ring lytic transglycosylase RlpA family protein [Neoehrlichia mikurensis]|uniref:Endolytic peptidoglycan transglycosylase RlpA n=1 Tax=Neoehrlichia mikurensis TaxID=89586 RepID=A0A9Q9BSY4_9RICK|nr:septal ring lytic transglycosylase RlpA family protein [Neoehrlichia mikurensis]QXK91935.1 septal ring lytic transglycosylase RlpA family protein [Neoehrlichia mikurensis]QXK93148.1 septal ring lytic transglycosylase RlpA family protein [Neoehrlichia mikurensis]QXK93628.1 septal ring lytic transglycosylase RlpA family protein [Neoehrlichia mikurensis]UTO55417.1 septal ring lytic transglycosylase RlpA family protein [Neoehrlichia mikurensis]UTO56336.1 septal ring lytic transglycosylase RlpA 